MEKLREIHCNIVKQKVPGPSTLSLLFFRLFSFQKKISITNESNVNPTDDNPKHTFSFTPFDLLGRVFFSHFKLLLTQINEDKME